MSLPRAWLATLTAAGALALGAAVLLQPSGPAEQPYALRKDGKIIAIRNCDGAEDEQVRVCAALACEQAVAESLVNPMEAQLTTTRQDYDGRQDAMHVFGSIRYRTSISIPLPTAYRCEVRDNRLVRYEVGK